MNRKPVATIFAMAAALSLCACGESTPPSAEVSEPAAPASAPEPVVSANAYAPVLEVPDELPDDPTVPMAIMMLESAVVPSADDVGIQPYPGAQLMSAMQGMKMSANGEDMTTWPALSMLTNDKTEDVAAFYTEQLPDWRYKDLAGMHMFWNGDENSNPLDISGQFSLVSITPIAEGDTIRAMWPDMRTRVDVRYEPATN